MPRLMRKGQSTAEYAIVIGLVIAAVVGMQVYVKRGSQGKFKDASDACVTLDKGGTDDSGVMYGANCYTQYEPQYSITPNMVSTRDATETATTDKGGGVTRAIVGNETSSRTGTQETLAPTK